MNVQGPWSIKLFLLLCLLCGLCGGSSSVLGDNRLDDTYSNSLPHVTDSKTSKGREVREGFYAHGLAWNQFNNTGISRFDEFWICFSCFSSTSINFLLDFVKFASDVSSVTIQNRRITIANLTGVVKNNDLCCEVSTTSGWLILRIRSNISTLDVLNRDVLDVKSNVISWGSFWQRFVMHFNRFYFSCQSIGCEGYNHAWFDDTSLNTTYWNCSNTSNFVHILEWETKRLIGWSLGWND